MATSNSSSDASFEAPVDTPGSKGTILAPPVDERTENILTTAPTKPQSTSEEVTDHGGTPSRELVGSVIKSEETSPLKVMEDSISHPTSQGTAGSQIMSQEDADIDCDGASQSIDEDSDNEDSSWEPTPATKPKTKSKTPRKAPRNAKEYFAWKEMEEARKETQEKAKRKRQAENEMPNKSRKLGPRQKQTPSAKQGSSMINSLHDATTNSIDESLDSMPQIQATTFAGQMTQLRASIPEGCDTRRTSTQRKDLEAAYRSFGFRKVRVVDDKYRLVGMKSDLMAHQLPAAAWMVGQECRESRDDGGILADGMGFGKTVISIACIVGNPPSANEIQEFSKATLVVVPNLDVANQWQEEIIKHCDDTISRESMKYSERDKRPIQHVSSNWVVIVTYKTVLNQYPKKEMLSEICERHEKDNFAIEKEVYEKSGPLFQARWYRVILDEAHAIKNSSSRTMKACCSLKRKFSWALSGTPLSNKTEEFYPYFKFIGCAHSDTLRDFRTMYVKDEDAANNLNVAVARCMYRRTPADTFMGRQILSLPETQISDIWIPMSAEEKIILKITEDRWQEIIEEIRDQGAEHGDLCVKKEETNSDSGISPCIEEVGSIKQQQSIACRSRVMKLRQGASHSFNLESMFRKSLKVEQVIKMKENLAKEGSKRSIIQQIRGTSDPSDGIFKFEKGLRQLEAMENTVFGGIFDINALLASIANEHLINNAVCLICKKEGPPLNPRTIKCDHIYCAICLGKVLCEAGNAGNEIASRCRHSGCNASLVNSEPLETLCSITEDIQRDKTYKEPGADSIGAKLPRRPIDNGCFLASNWPNREEISLVPGGKVVMAMAVVLAWMEEAPDDKIIIFAEFIMTAKVLGRMLELAGISFLYFFGDNSTQQREKALQEFKENSKRKILLVSIKTGGQSLNLTVANRVISIDPWWNTTTEKQALGRVKRMGQQKMTYWVQLWLKDSIDERINMVQKLKAKAIDKALQDNGHVPEDLDDEILRKLFTPEPIQFGGKGEKN